MNIEHIYRLANLKFETVEQLVKTVSGFVDTGKIRRVDLSEGLASVVVLSVVNAFKEHPEWVKSAFELSKSTSCLNFLLWACAVLLYEKLVPEEYVAETLMSYDNLADIGDKKFLTKIVMGLSDNYADFRVRLYKIILTRDNLRTPMVSQISQVMVKDVHLFDQEFLAQLARSMCTDVLLGVEFFGSLSRYDKEVATDFLCRFIPSIPLMWPWACWSVIYSFIYDIYDNNIRPLAEKFRSCCSPLPEYDVYNKIWNYLIGFTSQLDISQQDLNLIDAIVPLLTEKQFLEVARMYNPKKQNSIVLLKNPAITKNRKRFISILKTYLRCDNNIYFKKPLITIDHNILSKLSLAQTVALALKSIKSSFMFTPEALKEMQTRLTVAVTANMCKPDLMDSFLKSLKREDG